MIDSLITWARVDFTATDISYDLVLAKMALGIFLGALVGFERTRHGLPVGVRTFSLVALASVVIVQMTLYAPIWMAGCSIEIYRWDLSRLIRGLLKGISFLCGGEVLRVGFSMRGLTTAASVWSTACIGVLVGIGLYFTAIFVTFWVVLMLAIFQRIQGKIIRTNYARFKVVFARKGSVTLDKLTHLLMTHKMEMVGAVQHTLINDGQDYEIDVTIRSKMPGAFSKLSEVLRYQREYKTYSIAFIRN